MSTFDPFSPEYEPRIANGAIENIQGKVDVLCSQVEAIRRDVSTNIDAQNARTEALNQRLEIAISDFNEHAQAVLRSIRDTVKQEAKEMVKEELEKQVGNADGTE